MTEPRPTAAPPRPPSASGKRVLQLDVLRGVAILLVLGRHGINDVGDLGALRPFVAAWYRFGWTGVDLFFVLSGFLIGGLIFVEMKARDDLDVKRFYVRRAFKILPMYYVYLAIAAAALKLKVGGPPWYYGRTIVKGWVYGVLNLQNYLGTPWVHTWSLAVEEHFYFLLPLLLWAFAVRGRAAGSRIASVPAVPAIAAAAAVGCTALRVRGLDMSRFDVWRDWFPTHLRIDGLFFGVLLAYLYHYKPWFAARAGRHRRALLAAGLALVSPMLYLEVETARFVATWGFSFLYVGYGLILLSAVTTPLGVGWSGRALRSGPARAVAVLGFYSYPVYLFHVELVRDPLIALLHTWPVTALPPPVRWCYGMVLLVTLSWAVGFFFNELIERRVLAVRERLFPSKTAAPPA